MATDTFTDSNGTALTDHDGNWTDPGLTNMDIANAEINNNLLESTGVSQRWAAYYSNSQNEDQMSQALIKGADGESTALHIAVRMASGVAGYAVVFDSRGGGSAGNWTDLYIYKDEVFWAGGSLADDYAYADDHTLKIEAAGNASVDLDYYVDGNLEDSDTDSSSPLTGGEPGVYLPTFKPVINSRLDDWTDGISGVVLEQEGFRWRNDDGSESAATWRQNQDVNDGLGAGAKARLRFLINATGDPATKQYQIEGRVKGVGSWRKLEPPTS
jgi:hypothetical protein